MTNRKNCGGPLTKGNIQVVRPRGKKRPFRIHRTCPQARGNTAGSPLQRPQDSTGGPVTVEGVLEYSEPPKFRYFLPESSCDKLKKALVNNPFQEVTVQVVPVPDYQVEANPEAYADLVEIQMKGGMNHECG